MVFDGATTDPIQQAVRDALIAFMAATAEAQAIATREAQKAGIAAARAADPKAYRGRKPSYDRKMFETVSAMLGQGVGASAIATATGVSRQAILRIRGDRAGRRELWRFGGCSPPSDRSPGCHANGG